MTLPSAVVKNPPAGDIGGANLIPGLGRSPLQCSGLENSMNRGAWRAIIHGDAKNRT